MKLTAPMLAGYALLTVCGACSVAEDKYVADKDGKKELTRPLDLKEEQGGVAGTSVAEWRIEVGGRWRYSEYLLLGDDKVERIDDKAGSLTDAQITLLAKVLEESDPVGLPPTLGKGSKVNPHELTLTYGDTQVKVVGLATRRGRSLKELILRSGPPDDPDAVARGRFAAIADAVQDAVRAD